MRPIALNEKDFRSPPPRRRRRDQDRAPGGNDRRALAHCHSVRIEPAQNDRERRLPRVEDLEERFRPGGARRGLPEETLRGETIREDGLNRSADDSGPPFGARRQGRGHRDTGLVCADLEDPGDLAYAKQSAESVLDSPRFMTGEKYRRRRCRRIVETTLKKAKADGKRSVARIGKRYVARDRGVARPGRPPRNREVGPERRSFRRERDSASRPEIRHRRPRERELRIEHGRKLERQDVTGGFGEQFREVPLATLSRGQPEALPDSQDRALTGAQRHPEGLRPERSIEGVDSGRELLAFRKTRDESCLGRRQEGRLAFPCIGAGAQRQSRGLPVDRLDR